MVVHSLQKETQRQVSLKKKKGQMKTGIQRLVYLGGALSVGHASRDALGLVGERRSLVAYRMPEKDSVCECVYSS